MKCERGASRNSAELRSAINARRYEWAVNVFEILHLLSDLLIGRKF